MREILLPPVMDARQNVAFGECSSRSLAGHSEPEPTRFFVTVAVETTILMKTMTVIAKPRKLTPRGKISVIVNRPLTDYLRVGCVLPKKDTKYEG